MSARRSDATLRRTPSRAVASLREPKHRARPVPPTRRISMGLSFVPPTFLSWEEREREPIRREDAPVPRLAAARRDRPRGAVSRWRCGLGQKHHNRRRAPAGRPTIYDASGASRDVDVIAARSLEPVLDQGSGVVGKRCVLLVVEVAEIYASPSHTDRRVPPAGNHAPGNAREATGLPAW